MILCYLFTRLQSGRIYTLTPLYASTFGLSAPMSVKTSFVPSDLILADSSAGVENFEPSAAIRYRASPATCGGAILVPSTASTRSNHVETTLTAGANISTNGPKLLQLGRLLNWSIPPTVIASGAEAGERVEASRPSLPAPTTLKTPAL